jgi:hypothetical protein
VQSSVLDDERRISFKRCKRVICAYNITGSAASPQLLLITCQLLEELGSTGLFSHDLLIYDSRDRQRGEQTLSITSLPPLPAATRTYHLPSDFVLGTRIVGSTICASIITNLGATGLSLYHLPDISSSARPTGMRLQPYATFETPDWDPSATHVHHCLSPFRSLTERGVQYHNYLISMCGVMHRVQTRADDPSRLTCARIDAHTDDALDDVEAICMQGVRICTVTTRADNAAADHREPEEHPGRHLDGAESTPAGGSNAPRRTCIRFHSAPLTAEQSQTASRRLGSLPPRYLQVRWPRRIQESDVEFDEWTGTAVVAFHDTESRDTPVCLSSWSVCE